MGAEMENPYQGKGLWNKVNRVLFPWIGPPPLGPYDQPAPTPAAERPCPLCGQPMRDHEIDRSGPRTQLYCPEVGAASTAAESDED